MTSDPEKTDGQGAAAPSPSTPDCPPQPPSLSTSSVDVIQFDRHRLSPPLAVPPLPPFSWRREPPDASSLGDVLIDDEGCLVLDVDDDHYSGRLSREDTLALAHAIYATIHAEKPEW